MKPFFLIRCSLLITLCFLFSVPSLLAYDTGLQLNQTLNVEDVTGDTGSQDNILSYSGTLLPWLSVPFGSPGNNTGKLYLSAGFTVLYTNEYADKTVFCIPELLRTELTWRSGENNEIKFGRMNYTDPLGFIASGLFDGARFSFSLNNSAIRIASKENLAQIKCASKVKI